MSIIRFRVEPLLEEDFHGVMHIREMATACLEYGMKPLSGLGVCYKNNYTRHFYVDVEIDEQTLLEFNLTDSSALKPGFMLQNNKYKFTVVDKSVNLMQNTAHSMFETYYDPTVGNANIFRSSSFYGEQPDIPIPRYVYEVSRDEYSDSVSYEQLLKA